MIHFNSWRQPLLAIQGPVGWIQCRWHDNLAMQEDWVRGWLPNLCRFYTRVRKTRNCMQSRYESKYTIDNPCAGVQFTLFAWAYTLFVARFSLMVMLSRFFTSLDSANCGFPQLRQPWWMCCERWVISIFSWLFIDAYCLLVRLDHIYKNGRFQWNWCSFSCPTETSDLY